MNILKTTIAAGVLAVAAHTASAQTTIVLTGSSAYRGATVSAIKNLLGATYSVGYIGTDESKANAHIYKGTIGGNAVIVKCSWSGSAAGVQTVAATTPTKTVGVFADSVTPAPTTGISTTTGLTDPRTGATQVRPDIAMSDTFQGATLWNGTYLGVAYAGLVEATPATVGAPNVVGVVPFKWVASNSAPAGLNMTPAFANSIYTTVGAAPLALLTGNLADETTAVYGAGRDPDSGTRITAFAETGIGANTGVQQFQPTASGGAITSVALYAATTINGVPVAAGNSGESSGGTLAGLIGNTGPAAGPYGGGFMVTYLSTGDAATAITAGAHEMSYNGVTYSTGAVNEGQYTFWGYEHMLYRSGTTGVVKSTADAIADNIYTTTATIKITSMKVARSTDGGTIGATYF